MGGDYSENTRRGSLGAILKVGYHSLSSDPQRPLPPFLTSMCTAHPHHTRYEQSQAYGKNNGMSPPRFGYKNDCSLHLGKITLSLSQMTGNAANSCHVFRTQRSHKVKNCGPQSKNSWETEASQQTVWVSWEANLSATVEPWNNHHPGQQTAAN